jgi:hypothetical protein
MLSPAGVKKRPANWEELKEKNKKAKKSFTWKLVEKSWEK